MPQRPFKTVILGHNDIAIKYWGDFKRAGTPGDKI